MSNLRDIQHDIKRDVHNILSLLKYIKEDNEVQGVDNKLMLERCLEREKTLNSKIELISKFIDKNS